ncbi:MAG: hypothetical protein O3B75_07135 [Planctomycetota bacterium]|nr:hypothetical protein [Planctomycetota bacterium]
MNKSTPLIVRSWHASGDPKLDLPTWTQSFDPNNTVLASRSVQSQELSGEKLAETTRDIFCDLISSLPHAPCRMWVFLPRPTDQDGDFLERYMRFNEGRTNAFRSLCDVVTAVPAGTCVGHSGTALVVHALCNPRPFVTCENPRQRPAWLYSNRFGPVSPSFVRGTICQNTLLASGTAAIVGEQTLHELSIDLQFEETIRNMKALTEASNASGKWRSLQIYVRDSANLERVECLASNRFPGCVERILHAQLCRSTLMVEIEGVCDVNHAQA